MSETKRYFTVDDGGADYIIVARDVEHAKQILRDHGIEFTKEDGDSAPIDDPAFASLAWDEMNAESVAKQRVWMERDGKEEQWPLVDCDVGDFFCSEF